MSKDEIQIRQDYWICVLLFIIAVAARVIPAARTIDDAFITFRYAQNILSGEGFVYNPGEHVLGTTTPLYTLLLVSIGFIHGAEQVPFAEISMTVNALFDGLTCIMLFLIGSKLSFRMAGLGAALTWAIAPFSVTFAIGGLETSIYVFLLTAIIYTHIIDNNILAAFLSSLAFLTRPDALILIVLIGMDRLIEIWRVTAKNKTPPFQDHSKFLEIGVFLTPILAWWSFALPNFGSILPHSIQAKTVAYRLSAEAGLVRFIQHYATPFMGNELFGIPWIGVGIILYPFLYMIGAMQAYRINHRSLAFLLYPWLYFLIFSIANPLIFRWYLTPPLPVYILVILIGMQILVTSILDKLYPRNKLTRRKIFLAGFVILFPFILMMGGWSLKPDHGVTRPAPKMAWYKLEILYKQAANFLEARIDRYEGTPTLAAGDVGVLGYYTKTIILDTVGLNSPESTAYYPLDETYYVINYAVPPDLIIDQQPDFVVLLEVYGRAGLFKDDRFWQDYQLINKIDTDIYGSDGMLIFEKKPYP